MFRSFEKDIALSVNGWSKLPDSSNETKRLAEFDLFRRKNYRVGRASINTLLGNFRPRKGLNRVV